MVGEKSQGQEDRQGPKANPKDFMLYGSCFASLAIGGVRDLHRDDQRQHHRPAFQGINKKTLQGLADLFLDFRPVLPIFLLPQGQDLQDPVLWPPGSIPDIPLRK